MGRVQVPVPLPERVLRYEERSLLSWGSCILRLSNDAQLSPSSNVGWHQPRFSVGVWRQRCYSTPATQGLKLAW